MKQPKILALYLPQYYENEDNNKWWGKGFTDWVSVKKAVPCFDGHFEPRVPLNNNYYDLSDADTMRSQAFLADKYGIDGFLFYHYYFGNDKYELEKPAENLLREKDINMPFCFAWANQSWIRSWSKFTGNVWGEKLEGKQEENDGMLVRQDYGEREEWVKHFEYLLPFFNDARYMRYNNKPIFVIYKPGDISCLKEMIDCWQELAQSNGLAGIYIMGFHTFSKLQGLDAIIIHEPGHTLKRMNASNSLEVKNGVRCFDYSDFCGELLNTEPVPDIKTYYTGITGYDNTPRRGNNGESIIESSAELFEEEIYSLLLKSLREDNDFLFINAWNEWGEGMYIEPDEDSKYAYLQAVKYARDRINEMSPEKLKEEINREAEKEKNRTRNNTEETPSFLLNKYQFFFRTSFTWLSLLSDGKLNFKSFFDRNNVKSIAVYGLGDIGRQLLSTLRSEGIKVKYCIDRYVGDVSEEFKVYRPEENLPDVDMIIVTAFDPVSIKAVLQKRIKTNIIDLLNVLTSMIENDDK